MTRKHTMRGMLAILFYLGLVGYVLYQLLDPK